MDVKSVRDPRALAVVFYASENTAPEAETYGSFRRDPEGSATTLVVAIPPNQP